MQHIILHFQIISERLLSRLVSFTSQIYHLRYKLINALDLEQDFESIGSTYLKSDESLLGLLQVGVRCLQRRPSKRSERQCTASYDDNPSKSKGKNIRCYFHSASYTMRITMAGRRGAAKRNSWRAMFLYGAPR